MERDDVVHHFRESYVIYSYNGEQIAMVTDNSYDDVNKRTFE